MKNITYSITNILIFTLFFHLWACKDQKPEQLNQDLSVIENSPKKAAIEKAKDSIVHAESVFKTVANKSKKNSPLEGGKEVIKNQLFNLDLMFVENKGQVKNYKSTDRLLGEVKFATQAGGASAFFGEKGILFTFFKGHLRDMTAKSARRYTKGDYEAFNCFVNFVNANKSVEISGEEEKITKFNYLLGNDAKKHITNVGTYGEVKYTDLYPNIDLKYYSANKQLKYDYIIKPGGEVSSIHLAYSADNVEINKRGELEVKNEWGKILEERPYAYQNISGRIKTIQVQYRKIGNKSNHIGFKVIGEYDTTRALIIDPAITLSWLTYYGTTAGGAPTEDGYLYDLDIDNAGNIYTTGWYSSVFPATAGAYMTASPGGVDAYASKLDPTGSILIWATFLGGGGVDRGWGIRVDAANNVYVAGVTENTPPAYPTTAGAFQTAHAGGTNDVFLSKLNSTGSALLFSTFIGGTNNEEGRGIDVDASGNTYITGFTNSVDYKTQGPIQAAFAGVNDAFVTKVNSTGTALLYSTYLGGDQDELGWDIVVDASNIAYVTGYTGSPNTDAKPFPTVAAFQAVYGGGPKDVFVTKVNAAGSAYVFSTYLGGGNIDQGNSIRLSAAGEVVVGGTTYGAGFPLVANLQTFTGGGDGFVAKFNVAGSALSFSTPYGGSNDDLGLGIAVKNNLIILKTAVMSNDITTTGSPYQATKPANDGASLFDVALAVYDNTSGSYLLTYASYFGGYLNDYDDLGAASLAIDNSNCLIVGATTHSLNLPVTAGVYQTTKNTANNVTPDQPFVFKLCNIPLPVTLISFTATQQQDNSALVQWTTGYEKNNDYFVVERSTDGINFTPIGTVKGDGNSSSSVDYSFVDPNGNIPVIYYRLKQVDVNGQFEYSQIIVLYPGKAHTISIESGSLQGTFTVNKIFLSQASIEILVIDALGREIIHTSKEAGAGSFQETIDLRKFSSGVYIIHAFSQDDNKISKVIKE